MKQIAFQGTLIRCRRRLSRRRLAARHVTDERRRRSVRRCRDWSEHEGLFDRKPAVQSHRPGRSASRARPDAGRRSPPGAGRRHRRPPSDAKPPPRSKRSERLFSDQPIPFDLLRIADADLTLAIADLHSGGADYKAIDTHAVLKDGKLAIDPFAAQLPGGHLAGSASVDATQSRAAGPRGAARPGLALKTVLSAVHEPSVATGNLEVYADLRGAGDSPHAIAASLDGSLGLAMAGGTIDNRLLGSLLGKLMNTLNALNLVGKGGDSELRCFGLRMEAQARHRDDKADGPEFLSAHHDRRAAPSIWARKPCP